MPTIFSNGTVSWAPDRGPALGLSDPTQINQPEARTDGTTRYLYDKGTDNEFDLPFERLTRTDYDALKTFLAHATVNWKMTTFTYTDQDSTTHTVRLVNDRLQFAQVAFDQYSGSIQLRKE